MAFAKGTFGSRPGVEVQDFYTDGGLTADEKGYLHGLQALGSIADMMKNRAIINNKDRRHLQIDSNTKVHQYAAFYRNTIGREPQQDGLNASFYDRQYVSVHNKVVYTMPGGALATSLEQTYMDYCHAYKDDLADKAPEKNSMYARVFARSMAKARYARQAEILDTSGAVLRRYPARMELTQYTMTKHIVTPINMSWAPTGVVSTQLQGLMSIPPIQISRVVIDYPAFFYVVKKHTFDLDLHNIGAPDASDPREQLLALSDRSFDRAIVVGYLEYVKANHPGQLVALIESIPPTPLGNAFVEEHFSCSRDELLLIAQKIQLDKRREDLGREQPGRHGRLPPVIQQRMAVLKVEIDNLDSKILQCQAQRHEAMVAGLATLDTSEIHRRLAQLDQQQTAVGTQTPRGAEQVQIKKYVSQLRAALQLKQAGTLQTDRSDIPPPGLGE
jgi:hypothetical protein